MSLSYGETAVTSAVAVLLVCGESMSLVLAVAVAVTTSRGDQVDRCADRVGHRRPVRPPCRTSTWCRLRWQQLPTVSSVSPAGSVSVASTFFAVVRTVVGHVDRVGHRVSPPLAVVTSGVTATAMSASSKLGSGGSLASSSLSRMLIGSGAVDDLGVALGDTDQVQLELSRSPSKKLSPKIAGLGLG